MNTKKNNRGGVEVYVPEYCTHGVDLGKYDCKFCVQKDQSPGYSMYAENIEIAPGGYIRVKKQLPGECGCKCYKCQTDICSHHEGKKHLCTTEACVNNREEPPKEIDLLKAKREKISEDANKFVMDKLFGRPKKEVCEHTRNYDEDEGAYCTICEEKKIKWRTAMWPYPEKEVCECCCHWDKRYPHRDDAVHQESCDHCKPKDEEISKRIYDTYRRDFYPEEYTESKDEGWREEFDDICLKYVVDVNKNALLLKLKAFIEQTLKEERKELINRLGELSNMELTDQMGVATKYDNQGLVNRADYVNGVISRLLIKLKEEELQ